MRMMLMHLNAKGARGRTVFFLVLVLLLTGWTSSAQAQTYSCITSGGKFFFTDDPAVIPPDCREPTARERAGEGGLSIMELPTLKPSPARDVLEEKKDRREQKNRQLEEWKKNAEDLRSRYLKARKRLHRTSIASEKRQIRQDIREIKARRDALLLDMDAARLSFRDREAIEAVLTTISRD